MSRDNRDEPTTNEELAAMLGSEVTPLGSQAGQLHEVYTEQLKAGFTAAQSLYLVGCILTGSPGPAPDGDLPDPNE